MKVHHPRSRARVLFGALSLMLFPTEVVLAGEILGQIVEGGKPIAEGTAVTLVCSDKKPVTAKTDKAGAYRLFAEAEGKCTLALDYKGQKPTLEVVSFEDPVQVDLVLELKDGKFSLRRK